MPMTAHPVDASLLQRARGGAGDALAELYVRYGNEVHAVAYRLLNSDDDAADVTQDVFLGLPEALRSFGGGSFRNWLLQVTTRASLMRIRGERRHRDLNDRYARLHVHTGMGDRVTDRVALERALSLLDAGLRAVFVLKEIQGYAHAEIAEMLGITVRASEMRLVRARKALLDMLRSA